MSGLFGARLGGEPPVEGDGVAAAGASLAGLLVPPPSDLLPELYRSLYQPDRKSTRLNFSH